MSTANTHQHTCPPQLVCPSSHNTAAEGGGEGLISGYESQPCILGSKWDAEAPLPFAHSRFLKIPPSVIKSLSCFPDAQPTAPGPGVEILPLMAAGVKAAGPQPDGDVTNRCSIECRCPGTQQDCMHPHSLSKGQDSHFLEVTYKYLQKSCSGGIFMLCLR